MGRKPGKPGINKDCHVTSLVPLTLVSEQHVLVTLIRPNVMKYSVESLSPPFQGSHSCVHTNYNPWFLYNKIAVHIGGVKLILYRHPKILLNKSFYYGDLVKIKPCEKESI